MGYMSDVGVVIKEHEYKKFVKEKRVTRVMAAITTSKLVIDDDRNYFRILIWKNIKWYDVIGGKYCDITYFMNYLRSNLSYEYIRIGQDANDVEYENNLQGNRFFEFQIRINI